MAVEAIKQEAEATTSPSIDPGSTSNRASQTQPRVPEPFERSCTPQWILNAADQIDSDTGEGEIDLPGNPRNARNDEDTQPIYPVERFFERTDAERSPRVEIDLTCGFDPYELVPALWRLIADDNRPPRLFMTDGGELVRFEIVEGELRQTDLTADRLTGEVHRVTKFTVATDRGAIRLQPCPSSVVREMRAVPFHDIPLARLRQVANAPLVGDESGRIISENGYHRDLGIFLWCAAAIPPIPNEPTGKDIEQALKVLLEPLRDFPFVSDASRATALAIMVTAFVRRLIKGPTPLHLIEKATPGTGATLLSDVLLTPAIGKGIPRIMPPKSEHEWEYSLSAVLRTLPAAVVIDNVRELTSPQLAKAVTDDVMLARIVGSSNVASIPVLCVWVSTGNNPILHQEIARRTVRCRLDAGVERPWLREKFGIPDLKTWLQDHRSDMIWAVLTLIRSWFVAGQPKGDRVLGMFESYSQIVGGILGNAGVEGFLDADALADASGLDLQTEAERWLVTCWWARHKRSKVGVSDLIEMTQQPDSPVLELWGAESHPSSYGKRLGWLLRGMSDKTIKAGGTISGPGATVRVQRAGEDSVRRTALYRLEPLDD